MNSKRNINIFLVSLIFIFAIILGWSFANLFNNNDPDQYIDNSFNLINHNGEKVSIKSYLNKNKVFFFGFTHCPDVCPMGVSILSNIIDNIDTGIQHIDKLLSLFDEQQRKVIQIEKDMDKSISSIQNDSNKLNEFSEFTQKINSK